MQHVTTKSFSQILATSKKAGLILLILAFATSTASAKPAGLPEVFAVLEAIQLKLEKLETDHQNIDTIIVKLEKLEADHIIIDRTTGDTKAAVFVVKSTTETIKGTTGDTKAAVFVVKSTTDAINTTTGQTKDAVAEVQSTTDEINTTTGLTKEAVNLVQITTDLTKNTVDTVKILADLNLDEDLFSIDVCFDVGLGLASSFGMDARLAFNAEGRIGAEAFGNGVIGKVYGDGGLAGSLKSNLGASAVGVACLDIKSLIGNIAQTQTGSQLASWNSAKSSFATASVLEDIELQLELLANQLNINPTTLSMAMEALPEAASRLMQPDLSLLDISSEIDGPLVDLLEALPLPPGIDVASVKDQTSAILGEFEPFVENFADISTFCLELGHGVIIGIPSAMSQAIFSPMCDVHDATVGTFGGLLKEAMDTIILIKSKLEIF